MNELIELLRLCSLSNRRIDNKIPLKTLKLARRHGLLAFFQNAVALLKEDDSQNYAYLKSQLDSQIQLALALHAESIRLTKILSFSGLTPIYFKGAALSLYLYANPTCRYFADIDLLMHPKKFILAAKELESNGYQCALTGWQNYSTDTFLLNGGLPFRNKTSGLVVELHAHIAEHQYIGNLPISVFFEDKIAITANGVQFYLPSKECLFLALCIHGTKHLWSRLIWLHDVYTFLKTVDLDISKVQDLAQRYQVTYALFSVQVFLTSLYSKEKLPVLVDSSSDPKLVAKICKLTRQAENTFSAKFLRYWHLLKFFKKPTERAIFIKRSLLALTPAHSNSLASKVGLNATFAVVKRVFNILLLAISQLISELYLILEAFCVLCYWSLLVRFSFPRNIKRYLEVVEGKPDVRSANKIVRYISGIARRLPWQVNCLPIALALRGVLARRGIKNRMALEVSKCAGDFKAHAWIEVGNEHFLRQTSVPSMQELSSMGLQSEQF